MLRIGVPRGLDQNDKNVEKKTIKDKITGNKKL